MAQRLKRWESPRRSGRNHKGQGGAARARQIRKQQKRLLKRLKANEINPSELPTGEKVTSPLFVGSAA